MQITQRKLKITTFVSVLFFCILLLPIVYLTFVNRASGDDYGYGVRTRAAWMGSHSLIKVFEAMCRTVRSFYNAWQGTWFSIAVFSLQPEVFSDRAYVIVAVLMLFLWIGSTVYLFRRILCKIMGFSVWSYLPITVCFLIISIEFIPGSKSSIYWFNGCAHYMLPFAMCQMVVAWLLKYSTEYRKSTFAGILIFMTLLGGSNYQAALFALIVAFYICIFTWVLKKDRRIFTLCIPIISELIGLAVSMKAPGNQRRAGEDFGFSVTQCLRTVGCSFLYAVRDIGDYVRERPLALVGLLFLFLLLIAALCFRKEEREIPHPIWIILMLFCLYSAMQAPAIYAAVSVSQGVPNTNYQVFLLTASGMLLLAADKLVRSLKGRWGEETDKKMLQFLILPGILLCMILALWNRSNIKTCTSWIALTYITSGQAEDYKQQMDLQTRLMEGDEEDVVVPGINDVQGPLMHMPVTANEEAWTNTVTAGFYGKRSVIAIERPVWMEIYGD
ncbi:MAG: hypothetical protein K2N00_12880 [Lachnospiraceae bacterium]|nr:hypothetical protein [Lachnospiraceae bacterium]